MAGDTVITVIGNLTGDPELRFTPSGAAVANFTIASTPRSFDRQSGDWKDGDTLFMRCSIWREAAENVSETLTKGMRVIAQGRLVQRSFDTREGEKRTVVEMQVDEIGPSLRYASAQVHRASRGGQGGGYGGGQGNYGPQGFQAGYGPPAGYETQGPPGGPDQSGYPAAPGPRSQGRPESPGIAPASSPSSDDPWSAPGVAGGDDEPPF